MKSFIYQSRSLLPVFMLLLGAFLSSTFAYAQSENKKQSRSKVEVKSNTDIDLKKTISVKEVDGETVVIVTTETGGHKNVEKYSGQEAEDYLENSSKNMIREAAEQGFEFSMDSDDEETVKVIMMHTDTNLVGSKVVWVSDGDDEMDVNIKANSVKVNNEDGVISMDINYTGEDGEEVAKMLVFNESEIVNSLADIQELLKDMDVDITTEDVEGNEVKTVIVTQKMVLDETSEEELEDLNNSMFKDFGISVNLNRGQIQLDFETISKEKGTVSVLDISGNILFKDNFNGNSKYTKNITISNYNGIAILKIEQGDNVEVRKLSIE